jgi:hypothetical protein
MSGAIHARTGHETLLASPRHTVMHGYPVLNVLAVGHGCAVPKPRGWAAAQLGAPGCGGRCATGTRFGTAQPCPTASTRGSVHGFEEPST